MKERYKSTVVPVLIILTALILLQSSGLSAKKKEKSADGFLVTASELDKVLLINSENEIIREIPAENTYDAWILKNQNILVNVNRGVKIVSPLNEEVFSFKSEHEVYACQPINNNRILIGECSAGRLIEINKKGNILKTIALTFDIGGHSCFRGARKLNNGNYLVAHYGDKTVREYDKNGTVIQEFVRPNQVYSAQRLKNGDTVISDQYTLSIYNKSGVLNWEFDSKEHPELGVNHLTGFQCLPNGDIVICNWLGHPPYQKGIPIFKVNRAKEVIWKFHNAKETYSCTNIQIW